MRVLCFLAGGMLIAGGAEPVLTHLHPAGVQRGTSATIKLVGKFEPWPCRIWIDAPGIVFTPAKDVGVFDVVVAADVKTGPHLLRAYNDEGASAPISMVVEDSLQTDEKEPNDDFRVPQGLPSKSATCNGRLAKPGDVDSFSFSFKTGQTMVVWAEANMLAAGFDAMLRIVDSKGVTLAFNHDYITMDPFLVFSAPEDGQYIVQMMGQRYPATSEINFVGGDDCVYRLHASTEAVVRNTWPLAVRRGTKTSVMLEGWNLANSEVEIDENIPAAFPITFSNVPEYIETAEAQILEIPSGMSGRIETLGDEDRYTFSTSKDTKLAFTVCGPTIGSAIDPWLKIRDNEGKELATNDDARGTSEPHIIWSAPSDKTYTVTVGDLTTRGGPDFFYHLLIGLCPPTVRASVATHSVKVEAGKTFDVKPVVSFANNFQSKLKLAAKGLPTGVTAAEVDVPEKGGEVTITLTAGASAARASLPWQLVLREIASGKEHEVIFSMVTTTENNGVPQGYQKLLTDSTDQLWLSVTVPPPSSAPVPAQIPSVK